MDAALRRVSPALTSLTRLALGLPAVVLFAVPLSVALIVAAAETVSAEGWRALWADVQFLPALRLSLATGLGSTALALAVVLWWVPRLHGHRAWAWMVRVLGPVLSLPHLAFAIGLALLVMPSGVLMRLAAPWAGWEAPPPWPTVNDGWGLALMAALVAKELPYLLWNVAALLHQGHEGARLQRELTVAASMGYGPVRAWHRLLWPQLLPRLAWPLAAVLAYGYTVVDMAVVLGPTTPPTLGVLAWQWLLDASPERQAQGAAAVGVLCALWLLSMLAAVLAWRLLRGWRRRRATQGQRGSSTTTSLAGLGLLGGCIGLYSLVMLAVLGVSFVGVWPFPDLVPQRWTAQAWEQVLRSPAILGHTLGLALVSSSMAALLVMAWMEATPRRWDLRCAPAVYAPMVLPSLLLTLGLYRGALELGLDARWWAVAWAHGIFVLPYVWVALAPAYRAYDVRYRQVAVSLRGSEWRHWWAIKLPLLRAPLAAAWAVGVAVSVAQFLPTQFLGAGRVPTVTTEALTLAAGGQRHTMAAFAALQMLVPVLAFAGAAWVGHRAAWRERA
jgi:putative thiamine transport system permease protein